VDLNLDNGISVFFYRCIIRDNICTRSETAAGIYIGGRDNRIEGNNCVENSRGIQIASAGNLIIKNSCSGNATNWNIAAGNSYLIVQTATTTSNFTGNAGGGGVGSTNPHANFTY
jgi:parallel beta-helix repeat protein